MIAIIDYQAGNLRSVELAFARLGIPARITGDPAVIAAAQGAVLPGVGAFAGAMEAMAHSGLIPAIRAFAGSGRPFLGICLGMQALFDGSEEGRGIEGLGLIPGRVRRLPDCGLKVPHMGWNSLEPRKDSPLLEGLPTEPYAYFVHSYACEAAQEDVLAVTEYGVPFHSMVQRGAVMGVQFHPEKSGADGQRLLRNFAAMAQ
ncbi:MAG: imidazole glycerol phosphate synthase subunit HisH [Clostridiales bacterium]|nr:imidazole glycerol phosphate synthase subunit HisH [Clostridiales bacterium]